MKQGARSEDSAVTTRKKILVVVFSEAGVNLGRAVASLLKYHQVEAIVETSVLRALAQVYRSEMIVTEWHGGYGNLFWTILHFLRGCLTGRSNRASIALALILKRRVVVLPHGLNFYGSDSWSDDPTPPWRRRDSFREYGVSTTEQRAEAAHYGVLRDNIFLVGLLVAQLPEKVNYYSEGLLVCMPKISRIDAAKLRKVEAFANKFSHVICMMHPHDSVSDYLLLGLPAVWTYVDGFDGLSEDRYRNVLDCGTSGFLAVVDAATSLYRINATPFNHLLYDEFFSSGNPEICAMKFQSLLSEFRERHRKLLLKVGHQ